MYKMINVDVKERCYLDQISIFLSIVTNSAHFYGNTFSLKSFFTASETEEYLIPFKESYLRSIRSSSQARVTYA